VADPRWLAASLLGAALPAREEEATELRLLRAEAESEAVAPPDTDPASEAAEAASSRCGGAGEAAADDPPLPAADPTAAVTW
jgi:hypothetical protein